MFKGLNVSEKGADIVFANIHYEGFKPLHSVPAKYKSRNQTTKVTSIKVPTKYQSGPPQMSLHHDPGDPAALPRV